MAASVYILAHRSGERFKIGKSLQVLNRIKAFGLKTLDLARSEVLAVKTGTDAYNLERALHRTFRRWRIPAATILAQGGAADGASEWFRAECTERLSVFLSQNRDLFQFERRPLQDPADLAAWLQCGETDIERGRVLALVGAELDSPEDWDDLWFESDEESDAGISPLTPISLVSKHPAPAPIASLGNKLLAAERLVGKSLIAKLRALCAKLTLLPASEDPARLNLRTLCGIYEIEHQDELDALVTQLESEHRPLHFVEGVFASSAYAIPQPDNRSTRTQSSKLSYASVVVVLRWPRVSCTGVELDPEQLSLREMTQWHLQIDGWDSPLTLNPRELEDLQSKALAELSSLPNFGM